MAAASSPSNGPLPPPPNSDENLDDQKVPFSFSRFMCSECGRENQNFDFYCRPCRAKHFKENFSKWTSGDAEIDDLIRSSQLADDNGYLEFVDYSQFESVEHLADGGFGTVYKAIWIDGPIDSDSHNGWDFDKQTWRRKPNLQVVLKRLRNCKNLHADFLNEIRSQSVFNSSAMITRYVGVSRDPESNEYIMISEFSNAGNLRSFVHEKRDELDMGKLLSILVNGVQAFSDIHFNGYTHRDVHTGNFLVALDPVTGTYNGTFTDFGLCQPPNAPSSGQIFGVMPFLAPELLSGGKHSEKTDIYGYGMIMYEALTGRLPFDGSVHDLYLAMDICSGLRPKIPDFVPKWLSDIIQKCWDPEPSRRPTAFEIIQAADLSYFGRLSPEEANKLSEERKAFWEKSTQNSDIPMFSKPMPTVSSPPPGNPSDNVYQTRSLEDDLDFDGI